ncbi:hypothetical protein Hdeb2414_s0016g00484231 [Helianthus debilis subsp. tardiflorus]
MLKTNYFDRLKRIIHKLKKKGRCMPPYKYKNAPVQMCIFTTSTFLIFSLYLFCILCKYLFFYNLYSQVLFCNFNYNYDPSQCGRIL